MTDHVYSVLKQRILSCALEPNVRLVEKALCDDLGISRTPLREALNRLGHEDLVTFQPHAGYRVAPITLEGFRNTSELRAIVEPRAAALAAERATEEDIARMKKYAELPFDPADERGFVAYCRANSRFHLSVVRSTRNPILENVVMSSLDMYQRPTYLRIGRQMDASNPSAKHEAIVAAIANRDAVLAGSLMERHVRGGVERIVEALVAAGYR